MLGQHALKVVPVLIAVMVFAACGGDGGESSPPATAVPTAEPTPTVSTVSAQPPAGGPIVKVQNQDQGGSGKYQFVPSDYSFKLGDTVTFEMTAETEFHTFTADDLGIDESVSAGETVTFTHTFDTAGTFSLICIPHEAFGMTGTITVGP